MTLTMKLDEARTKGLEEGRAEGRMEGLAEGRAEGAAEQNVAVALRLIAMGFSVEQICEATGLSARKVEKLKNTAPCPAFKAEREMEAELCTDVQTSPALIF